MAAISALLLLSGLLSGLLSPAARAQDAEPEPAAQAAPTVPTLNSQLYRIPIDAERTLWADDSGLAPDHHWRAKLGLVYTHDPLVFRYADSDDEVTLLGNVLQANVIGAYTFKRVRVGLDVPLYLLSRSDVIDGGGGGFGDIGLDFKGTILSRQEGAPVGVALGTRFDLPTATVATPLGNDGLAWTLQGIVDYEVGPVLLVANLGTIVNPDVPEGNAAWSDQLLWRLGAGYALDSDGTYGLSADLAGRASYNANGAAGGRPAEGLIGGWARFQDVWVARGGLGTGLSRGIGAPDFRMVATVGYEPPALLDADGDGVVDRLDACVSEPEDADGWQDADGCPDPSARVRVVVVDTLGDPVLGAKVRLVVEDGVTTLDAPAQRDLHPGRWAVTVEAPDFAAYEGQIEVPEGPEHEARVTMESLFGGVRVQVTDPEGNPVDATFRVAGSGPVQTQRGAGLARQLKPGDHDLVVRASGFQSANVPITVAQGRMTQADVTLQPARTTVTRDRVTIADKVYFETNSAKIKAESHSLLDEVAQVLRDYPEIRLLKVEGHTDSRGRAAYNQQLSQKRAESVMRYLVGKGVAASRLAAEGLGEGKPLDSADNEAAWNRNRRVEFLVEEWRPQDAPSTGAP